MEQAYEILKNTFRFPAFRLAQEEVIRRLIVDNENVLVLFPTGGRVFFTYIFLSYKHSPYAGGKSLTYQVPALCLDVGCFFMYSGDQTSIKPGSQGLTLVISPLIALMKDQVDGLVSRGVKAANMDSSLSADRMSWVRSEVLSGAMKILYVAPER